MDTETPKQKAKRLAREAEKARQTYLRACTKRDALKAKLATAETEVWFAMGAWETIGHEADDAAAAAITV